MGPDRPLDRRRARLGRWLGAGALGAALGIASPAEATFSIVAADTKSGAIGSAGASCVPYEVMRILRVASGKGLLVGQAYFDDDALAEGQSMLLGGATPDEVLLAVTDEATFTDAPRMQYGIVDIGGRTASVTGPLAKAYAGDTAGVAGTMSFTVQGNLLTGPAVLEHMRAGASSGCDLPARLMASLRAAGTDGGGDARCTGDGISAASAYLFVEEGGETTLEISLPDLRPEDPIAALGEAFDAWRADHPCPEPDPAPDPADPDPEPGAGAACSVVGAPFEGGSGGVLLLGLATLVGGRRRGGSRRAEATGSRRRRRRR